MGCCIVSSTTLRLKDKQDQGFRWHHISSRSDALWANPASSRETRTFVNFASM